MGVLSRGRADAGWWMLDAGCWMLDVGCWISSIQHLASTVAYPVAAAAARFFFQLDLFDRDAAVEGLAHIVDGERRDGNRREGLHFDARFGLDLDGGLDGQRSVVRGCEEIGDRLDGQG